jgi:hypothetical protein
MKASAVALVLLALVCATERRAHAYPGNASAGVAATPPNHAVQAAFTRRSCRPGTSALLSLRGSASRLTVQILQAGRRAAGKLQGAAPCAVSDPLDGNDRPVCGPPEACPGQVERS